MSQALTHEQVQTALAELSGWTHENDKLKKTFERQDFKDALSFIVRLGLHAECMDHHPELFNVYNRVVIELTTHDAGNKVTQKDVNLARAIESIA